MGGTSEERVAMNATVGDWLLVHNAHVGEHQRESEIVEVRGTDGGPPYLVRWTDDGHESLVFPGPDAEIRHG